MYILKSGLGKNTLTLEVDSVPHHVTCPESGSTESGGENWVFAFTDRSGNRPATLTVAISDSQLKSMANPDTLPVVLLRAVIDAIRRRSARIELHTGNYTKYLADEFESKSDPDLRKYIQRYILRRYETQFQDPFTAWELLAVIPSQIDRILDQISYLHNHKFISIKPVAGTWGNGVRTLAERFSRYFDLTDENLEKLKAAFKGESVTVPCGANSDSDSTAKALFSPLRSTIEDYAIAVTQANKGVAGKKPWTRGLYEGVIAADLILRQPLDQRNRLALIVLDSTLEIAFKDYLVNESKTQFSESSLLSLFSKRNQVHQEVKKHVRISRDDWKKIDHFYNLRCKLIHERASAGVSDNDVADFEKVVEGTLKKLFGLKFDRK